MPYSDFNENKYIFVSESSGTPNDLGSFWTQEPKEIEHIRLDFYKHGTEAGGETFTLKIYADAELTRELAASSAVALSSITGLSTYWIGWLRFDFSNFNVKPQCRYYVALTSSGYTRVGDTFYVGAAADWYPNLNNLGGGIGGYLELYERKELDVCG